MSIEDSGTADLQARAGRERKEAASDQWMSFAIGKTGPWGYFRAHIACFGKPTR
jgi:hypothetical protein